MANTKISKIIDHVITDVTRKNFVEIKATMKLSDIGRKSEHALGELEKLKRRTIPDYDEWTANFYMSWYQSRQIFLAYRVFLEYLSTNFAKSPSSGNRHSLALFDFGAGSMAGLVGIAIAVAKLPISTNWVPEIRVVSFDTSPAMLRLGEQFWAHFKDLTRYYAPASRLALVVDHTTHHIASDIEEFRDLARMNGQVCDTKLLTAFHTVYDDANQMNQVRSGLDDLVQALRPQSGWLTANVWSKDFLVKVISGLKTAEIGRLTSDKHDQECMCGQVLRRVTDFRENELLREVRPYLTLPASHVLLRNPVHLGAHNNVIYQFEPNHDLIRIKDQRQSVAQLRKRLVIAKLRTIRKACESKGHRVPIPGYGGYSAISRCVDCGTRFKYHWSRSGWIRGKELGFGR